MDNAKKTLSALLIGVAFYSHADHVLGAVEDVLSMKALLESCKSSIIGTIHCLTASAHQGAASPPEPAQYLPTKNNVVKALKEITERANAKHAIIIHFSGHGTITESGYLALALYDEVHGLNYLFGHHLAHLIGEMVKKGSTVTLVLDCCYSGGVRRNDHHLRSVRGFDFDRGIHPAPIENEALCVDLFSDPGNEPQGNIRRTVRLVSDWLINPQGFAVLCACSPYELAYGFEVDKLMRGALSYFLHRALQYLCQAEVEVSHQNLYQYLQASFHAEFPQQTPMWYGSTNVSIFGSALLSLNKALVPVAKDKAGSQLRLLCGQAQGVRLGDIYKLFPLDTIHQRDTIDLAPTATVISVGPLNSELRLGTVVRDINTGWMASLVSCAPPALTAVRVWGERGDIESWRAPFRNRAFIFLEENASTCDKRMYPLPLEIKCTATQEYEVIHSSSYKLKLTRFPSNVEESRTSVVDLVEHLAIYRSIEALENSEPSPTFTKNFQIEFCENDLNMKSDDSMILTATHQQRLPFTVRNYGTEPAYLHIYGLGPLWEIDCLTQQDGRGDFLVVPGALDDRPGEIRDAITPFIPNEMLADAQRQCEDVVKFFITSSTMTSFSPFVLRPLISSAPMVQDSQRGTSNNLSDLLCRLRGVRRGEDGDNSEEWTVKNFLIRTTYP